MKYKIMIVEDNPMNMRLMEMTLGIQNYTLLKATSGEQALDVIGTEQPDLIIMDMQLPGMSGFEVTRRLKETPSVKTIPIIGITAFAMKGDEEKVLEAGCSIYLSKPINTRELPKTIADMLAHNHRIAPGQEG
jgi:CheY-like chemotaxis protein